ncbi:hypothetical protein K505DRAFT_349470 [Melanomma pulvis-pyrius CBS 109.77]|uniref:Elongation factor 1 alpha-like protein n=1 Tax=Melanomma pulvis-pyrius CBS 109.77 TaxID=1314802 RepID=A0A6A6XDR5_9PLEO|nr:hypothetical protein K505DRAFT_349470 [Melanomma pulvis-pyrius CBS 109.77]
MPPKSGHHRAKNVGFDDDDGYSDDYLEEEEGDGMTDEDREQLRIGTAKAREALDSSITVSDAQIQESLWHYFYDVEKTVAYLKNKFAPTPKTTSTPSKKQKATSRFDQAASAAGVETNSTPGKQTTSHAQLGEIQESTCTAPSLKSLARQCVENVNLSDSGTSVDESSVRDKSLYPAFVDTFPTSNFFWDTPWGNVPPHRLGEITVEPLLPRGRLLGGSSKPSKLAALAAARKRKQDEAKNVASLPHEHDTRTEADTAVALLDRLSFKAKDTTGPPSIPKEAEKKPRHSRYPTRKRSPSPTPEIPKTEERPPPKSTAPAIEFPDLRAPPSIFASVLCGTSAHQPINQISEFTSFPLPYTNFPGFKDANPFANPSPDDLVLSAQAKGTKPKPAKTKKSNGEHLAAPMEKLAVDEIPRVKSKNLNVVEEFEKSGMKRMANFVVIGHVDHGKSTLMGRLLCDLKVVDQRSLDKLRKEAETIGKSSFALAWVMDQTSEERSRGVTVDIATNYFETEKTRFTILDAPGHRDFIPNMIAGASQADFAVLVIDASTNSFESGLKGQTKEHALLVRSMGVQRLVVAVNKMDTVSWSQERFEEISQQMGTFLTTASFSAKSITFIPCAGLTGENVTKKVEDPNAKWYTGETLIEALDSSEIAKRNIGKPLRLTIGDVFRGGITNPVSISGRIDAGSVQVGDIILAMPANETAAVKAIELENEPVDWAVAGQIPTLHLTDIDPVHLRSGDIVCDPKNAVKLIKSFTCKILAFEHVLPMSVEVFRGRLQAEGKVKRLVAVLNKTSGDIIKNKPRIVKPGEVARVIVELDRELPLEPGTRVVLREGGNTVAAGLLEVSI